MIQLPATKASRLARLTQAALASVALVAAMAVSLVAPRPALAEEAGALTGYTANVHMSKGTIMLDSDGVQVMTGPSGGAVDSLQAFCIQPDKVNVPNLNWYYGIKTGTKGGFEIVSRNYPTTIDAQTADSIAETDASLFLSSSTNKRATAEDIVRLKRMFWLYQQVYASNTTSAVYFSPAMFSDGPATGSSVTTSQTANEIMDAHYSFFQREVVNVILNEGWDEFAKRATQEKWVYIGGGNNPYWGGFYTTSQELSNYYYFALGQFGMIQGITLPSVVYVTGWYEYFEASWSWVIYVNEDGQNTVTIEPSKPSLKSAAIANGSVTTSGLPDDSTKPLVLGQTDAEKGVDVRDFVFYNNLTVGTQYRLVSSLKKIDANGAVSDLVSGQETIVTATTKTFDAAHRWEVAFGTHALEKGCKYVAVHKLYDLSGKELATHESLTDAAQTIEVTPEYTSVKVCKRWVGIEAGAWQNVQVQLKRTKNGTTENVGDPVTLTATALEHTWSNLDATYAYSVEELTQGEWIVSYPESFEEERAAAPEEPAKVMAYRSSGLKNGFPQGEYFLLVDASGRALAYNAADNNLVVSDGSVKASNGEVPEGSVDDTLLWKVAGTNSDGVLLENKSKPGQKIDFNINTSDLYLTGAGRELTYWEGRIDMRGRGTVTIDGSNARTTYPVQNGTVASFDIFTLGEGAPTEARSSEPAAQTLWIVNEAKVVKKVGFKIYKFAENELGQEVALSGARFGLYGADGILVGSYSTDGSGAISVSDLEPGSYYIEELEAPEGYITNGTQIRFTLADDKLAVDNHDEVGSFVYVKGDDTIAVSNKRQNVGSFQLWVTKHLVGTSAPELRAGNFEFGLYESNASFEQGRQLQVKANNTQGIATFDAIEVARPAGTVRYYLIKENAQRGTFAEKERITYDETLYGVKVTTVQNAEGHLEAQVERFVKGSDGRWATVAEDGMSFTNTYTPEVELPHTGGTGAVGFGLLGSLVMAGTAATQGLRAFLRGRKEASASE